MNTYSLTHLADSTLLSSLNSLATRDRRNTAEVLAHIAEVEKRRLFAQAGYSSMHGYCTSELHYSEQAAYKRIRVARVARRFPVVFGAVAEGRLNLSTIMLLHPFLTQATGAELLEAAEHKTRREVEVLLAERFPRADLPTRVVALTPQLSPGTVGGAVEPSTVAVPPVETQAPTPDLLAPEPVVAPAQGPVQLSPGTVAAAPPRPRLTPLSPARYGVQFTIDQEMHDKLERAQALLSHQMPGADVAQVLRLALDRLVEQLEKRKYAATLQPRTRQKAAATDTRYVPAHVKREVLKRDGARCTFVSETGRRCEARERLEFDHVHEFARGGQATVSNLRLRCRTHNQYAAECALGTGFMSAKREAAQRAASARATATAPARDARPT